MDINLIIIKKILKWIIIVVEKNDINGTLYVEETGGMRKC
jgi:hypothetical protein